MCFSTRRSSDAAEFSRRGARSTAQAGLRGSARFLRRARADFATLSPAVRCHLPYVVTCRTGSPAARAQSPAQRSAWLCQPSLGVRQAAGFVRAQPSARGAGLAQAVALPDAPRRGPPGTPSGEATRPLEAAGPCDAASGAPGGSPWREPLAGARGGRKRAADFPSGAGDRRRTAASSGGLAGRPGQAFSSGAVQAVWSSALRSATISAWMLVGTGEYLHNSMVNVPWPWVELRRSVE